MTREEKQNEAIRKATRATMAVLGMNHQQLAETLGICSNTLTNWMRDPGNIRLKELRTLEKMANKCGITFEQFGG